MPRDSSGNYTLPPGNPVVGGTTITPTWANPTMSDLAFAITHSLSRDGEGGMNVALKFAPGTLGAPGITWVPEPTSGFMLFAANDMEAVIAGVPRMRWTATDVSVWDTGTSAWLPITGPSGSNFALTNSPNVFTAASTNEFNALTTFKDLVRITASNACLRWKSPGAPLDTKVWDFVVLDASGLFQGRHLNDAESGGNPWVSVTPAGVGIGAIAFGDGGSTAFNFLGTGPVTFGGSVKSVLLVNEPSGNASYVIMQRAGVAKVRFGVEGAAGGAITNSQVDDAIIWSPAGVTFSGNSGGFGMRLNGTTGALELNAGSLGAPTLTFAADPSTGFWRATAGDIAVSCLGVEVLRLRNDALYPRVSIFAVDGTAGFPAYAFNNEQNSGMYRWGGGALGWSTLGTVRAILYATALEMQNNCRVFLAAGDVSGPGLAFAIDTDTGLWRDSANRWALSAGGVSVLQGTATFVLVDGVNTKFYLQVGSAAAPSQTFVGDATTGIFHPGTSTIGFACAGGQAASISSAVAQFLVPITTYYYFGSHDTTKKLYPNDGTMTWGTFYTEGTAGTYGGYGINDAMKPVFMSNGTAFGIHGITDGKWLISRDSSTVASTGYAFSAPSMSAASFTSTSSRAIKRETGVVRKASDILARLRPLLYRLLAGDDKEQLGLVAEEVHEVCPQLSDGKTVAYDRLAILLLAAWQEERGVA